MKMINYGEREEFGNKKKRGKKKNLLLTQIHYFASISEIKAAMDEAACQKALWEARQPEEEAKKAAEAAASYF
jgi:hypothetical protein